MLWIKQIFPNYLSVQLRPSQWAGTYCSQYWDRCPNRPTPLCSALCSVHRTPAQCDWPQRTGHTMFLGGRLGPMQNQHSSWPCPYHWAERRRENSRVEWHTWGRKEQYQGEAWKQAATTTLTVWSRCRSNNYEQNNQHLPKHWKGKNWSKRVCGMKWWSFFVPQLPTFVWKQCKSNQTFSCLEYLSLQMTFRWTRPDKWYSTEDLSSTVVLMHSHL